jgi:Family of unknown function (DUF6526)
MAEQNFSNHIRLVPVFHFIGYPVAIFSLVVSIIHFIKTINEGSGRLLAAAIVSLVMAVFILLWFARSFALKAHDKAIRAEENLRYFAITGKLLDSKLRMSQIIALRFAPNNELVDLAHRAVAENLSSKQIKQAIQHWKGDYNRV